MAHADATSGSTPADSTSSRSGLTPQFGRLSVEVDTSIDWDAKVNAYHDDDDGRTLSIVDNNCDWEAEVDDYWKGDNAPKRNTRTASVVDTRLDWDSAVDKYWNPSPSPSAAAGASSSGGAGAGLPSSSSSMNGIDRERKSDDATPINHTSTSHDGTELHSDEEDEVVALDVIEDAAFRGDSQLHSDEEDEVGASHRNSKGEANAFIDKLQSMEVSVVVFDLDNTACTQHSSGILPSKCLDEYINAASEDFKTVVPLLLKHKFKLAMASFTDECYYYTEQMRNTCEAGSDLIKLFLRGVFSDEVMNQFFIVGYNPTFHEDEPDFKKFKLHHMDLISQEYGCADNFGRIVLFDDSKRNVDSALEVQVRAFHTDPRVGFKMNDLLQRSPPGLEGDEADSEVDE